jgi:hypothetical protein
MPSQQRFWRHDEGWPRLACQEPARRRQKQPVDGGHRRTLGLSAQDGQFVPQHSDFELVDVSRAPTPERQRQDAAKEKVAEREQHGASDEVRCDAIFYAFGLALSSSGVRWTPARTEIEFLNPWPPDSRNLRLALVPRAV